MTLPRGYALNDVDLDGSNEFVFTREDGSVRPPVRSTQAAADAAVNRFDIVMQIALS